jgi:DNA-binding GntR family transcriptional regulator
MVEFLGNVSAESSVADYLRRQILTGELSTGDKLRQSDIAAELGVSTTPVREAFRSLTAEGLVEIDTHRGAMIRKLRDSELIEVLELQLVVEKEALRHSVPQMETQSLEVAESLHRKMLLTNDPTDWSLLNRDFHLALSAPSERTRTLRILRELFNVGTVQLREDIQNWDGRKAAGEADHGRILAAARAGNLDELSLLIDNHVGAAIEHLRELARVH